MTTIDRWSFQDSERVAEYATRLAEQGRACDTDRRERIATAVIAAFVANDGLDMSADLNIAKNDFAASVRYADALIAALDAK